MAVQISLKALRANNNLSLKEVADTIGVSRETYSKKESGESKITLDEGFALAELFNCSIADIRDATRG